jgi:hypothetical protein
VTASYPLRIWDPVTAQWYDVCGPPGPAGPRGPVGATGPSGSDASLPTGTEAGDLLWWDGSGWQVLSPDGVPGHVLTEVAGEGDAVLPEWTALPAGDTPVGQQQCGVAHRVAQQMQLAYNWMCSTALTALSVAVNTEGGIDSAVTLLSSAFTGPFAPLVGAFDTFASNWASADYLAAAESLGPLTPGQSDGLINAVYCAVQSLGTSVDFTADTITAIKAYIEAYPSWSSTNQRDLLQNVLDYLPLENWQTWAAQGALVPTAACSAYTCG